MAVVVAFATMACGYLSWSIFMDDFSTDHAQQEGLRPFAFPPSRSGVLQPQYHAKVTLPRKGGNERVLQSQEFLEDTNSNNNNNAKTEAVRVEYPLTRSSMFDAGVNMGRSYANRILERRKSSKHMEHQDNANVSSTNPFFWCRFRPLSEQQGRFMAPLPSATNNNNNSINSITTRTEGLFFVKTPKTASQSINRILRRSVSRVGPRVLSTTASPPGETTAIHSYPSLPPPNTPGPSCHLRGHHIQGNPAQWYSHRDKDHSLLVTSLRDPATRALSRIYWNFSTRSKRNRERLSSPSMLQLALEDWNDVETGCVSAGQGGFQLQYTSFRDIPVNSAWNVSQPTQVLAPKQIHAHVQAVVDEYDFILVQERLEESLVALQLLMGLDTADIVSMPLHVGGSYLYDRHSGCIPLVSPPKVPHLMDNSSIATDNVQQDEMTAFVDKYFQSPTWYAKNYGDYVLLGAAHASLDKTIADIGSGQFAQALTDFRKLQQVVLEVCSSEVVFPCSKNGTIQRADYELGKASAAGDRYPQNDIETCLDRVANQHR